ncbi:MAG: PQQ-dependent sugar dehydrogenase [Dehalococcoidales bacterium]|nr:PQQ-dependent sugar dehydrogenase [Dehalococcoidales bacterium]
MYRTGLVPAFIAVVMLAGCAVPSVATTTPVVPSPTVTANPLPPPQGTPVINVTTVVENLEVPWAIEFAPDGRIFVTERPGAIRIIKDNKLQPEPWLTLDVARTGEGGLLGLALDPAFAQNHFVYVYHTYRAADGQLQNRLVRLRENTATGKGTVDRVLLDGIRGAGNHDAGRLKFGPDGKLYVTTGDAAIPDLAQDTQSLNGKILRLNTDGTIPGDNPFPGSPVYSYGHRNPEGLAWQPGTNRLYATEHGSSAHDEVNYIEPGRNYGWPVITGDATREGMVTPVLQSGNSTWAPAGATFIRGGPWEGSLLFTGLRGVSLYRIVPDKANPYGVLSFEPLFTRTFGRLRDVAQSPDGTVYLLTSNRDGRGVPAAGDDRLLKLTIQ